MLHMGKVTHVYQYISIYMIKIYFEDENLLKFLGCSRLYLGYEERWQDIYRHPPRGRRGGGGGALAGARGFQPTLWSNCPATERLGRPGSRGAPRQHRLLRP